MQLDSMTITQKKLLVDDSRYLQVAALVYRISQGTPEYLIVTSRGTRRWIIPKGWPIPKKTLSQAALKEANEEAGVRGVVLTNEIGSYHYEKTDSPMGEKRFFKVNVFAVYFSHQEETWLEHNQRIFEWVSPEQAAERVQETELKKILLNFAKNLPVTPKL